MPNAVAGDGKKTESERILAMAMADARAEGLDVRDDPAPAEPAAAPEPDPEPSAEGLPEKGSAEDPTKESPKEPEKERMIPESVFQKRFDEMTAERHELRRELDALKAQLHTPKAEATPKEKEYSDEELRAIVQKYQHDPEHPEYATTAQEMLLERKIERKLAERDKQEAATRQTQALMQQHQQVWTDLQKTHPELSDKGSELFKLADEEYQKIPLRKRQEWPDEMERAVGRAQARLEAAKRGTKSAEVVRASAAARKGVVPLGGTSRAAAPATPATLDKLHQAAVESGDTGGPAWLAYIKAVEASKSRKKKEE